MPMRPLNVLFLAAEATPYAKVGGLGDVAGALPLALRALPPSFERRAVDVRLVLPLHPVIKSAGARDLGSFYVELAGRKVKAEASEARLGSMPVYFIDGAPVRACPGVYATDARLERDKFAFFSLAALHLPRLLNWQPDILHANDWHAGLAPYASLSPRLAPGWQGVRRLVTIHNLGFLGPNVRSLIRSRKNGLPRPDLPLWARGRPFPLGLWAADAISTVSPSYAREITTRRFGMGLDAFFRSRRPRLFGILNGIDTTSYDPATDAALEANFTMSSLATRPANKLALQAQLGLPPRGETMLMGVVSRMDSQKGTDLLLAALRSRLLAQWEWQVVLLGTGATRLEAEARRLEERMPDRVRVAIRFDDRLARRIYGGCDLLLMPSRFEPCGLSQMMAMRYGCVPLVRAVGGLKDTVEAGRNGFTYDGAGAAPLARAIERALQAYNSREEWTRLQIAGMSQDFSWDRSAAVYSDLYHALVAPTGRD